MAHVLVPPRMCRWPLSLACSIVTMCRWGVVDYVIDTTLYCLWCGVVTSCLCVFIPVFHHLFPIPSLTHQSVLFHPHVPPPPSRDLKLSDGELWKVIDKSFQVMKAMPPAELPPVIYQLLTLSTKVRVSHCRVETGSLLQGDSFLGCEMLTLMYIVHALYRIFIYVCTYMCIHIVLCCSHRHAV